MTVTLCFFIKSAQHLPWSLYETWMWVLYCDIYFITVVWNWTLNIFKVHFVCLYHISDRDNDNIIHNPKNLDSNNRTVHTSNTHELKLFGRVGWRGREERDQHLFQYRMKSKFEENQREKSNKVSSNLNTKYVSSQLNLQK